MGNCCCGDSVVDDRRSSSNNTNPASPSKEVLQLQQEPSKQDDSVKSPPTPRSIGKEIAKEPSSGSGSGSGSGSSSGSDSNSNDKISAMVPSLKIYTYAELKSATRNFRPDSVLGEGGFGTVFKGWVDPKTSAPSRVGVGIPVAVKKANADSSQGLKEWQAEVKFLGKFTHPNLVKLLGFCWEDNKFLLVYEYMQKGSLENHLFRRGAEPLTWEIRLKIAIGAARGLDHLHSSENKVIYRDFKTSNILLDGDYNAKLSDFGLAKLGPIDGDSHVSTLVVGTYGYAAPEYVATGHLYVKSDVYGFGVVLLEMLTGLIALDTNRPGGEVNLVEWAKPSLSEKRKLKKIMDPKLEGKYPLRAAYQAAELILKCLELEPKNRPSMEEVLHTLEKVNSIVDTKQKGAELSPLHLNHQQRQHGKSYNNKSPINPKHGLKNAGGRGYDLPSTSRSS